MRNGKTLTLDYFIHPAKILFLRNLMNGPATFNQLVDRMDMSSGNIYGQGIILAEMDLVEIRKVKKASGTKDCTEYTITEMGRNVFLELRKQMMEMLMKD